MDRISVCKKFSFEAAHFLPDYNGLCKDLHGHSFKLEIEVYMDAATKRDMVIDFKDLKNIVQENIISKVDHKLLNNVFTDMIPTAENLIRRFRDILKGKFFGHNCALRRIKLYETENSFAEWTKE
jgi:6-pyruvoyltetrahydropterin/6-carboxytetrahydropterin synthase